MSRLAIIGNGLYVRTGKRKPRSFLEEVEDAARARYEEDKARRQLETSRMVWAVEDFCRALGGLS